MLSPFYLLYGRDPRLPTEAALTFDPDRSHVDIGDFKVDLCTKLSESWELAMKNIQKAQKQHKDVYDCHAKHT